LFLKKEGILTFFSQAFPGHESGAYAISYEPNSQLLFSGGKKGEIGKAYVKTNTQKKGDLIVPFQVVSDIRQRTTMCTFTAHHSRIRSIAIDTDRNALITGSIDGEMKVCYIYSEFYAVIYYSC
jgi:WD40 repeat protein